MEPTYSSSDVSQKTYQTAHSKKYVDLLSEPVTQVIPEQYYDTKQCPDQFNILYIKQ